MWRLPAVTIMSIPSTYERLPLSGGGRSSGTKSVINPSGFVYHSSDTSPRSLLQRGRGDIRLSPQPNSSRNDRSSSSASMSPSHRASSSSSSSSSSSTSVPFSYSSNYPCHAPASGVLSFRSGASSSSGESLASSRNHQPTGVGRVIPGNIGGSSSLVVSGEGRRGEGMYGVHQSGMSSEVTSPLTSSSSTKAVQKDSHFPSESVFLSPQKHSSPALQFPYAVSPDTLHRSSISEVVPVIIASPLRRKKTRQVTTSALSSAVGEDRTAPRFSPRLFTSSSSSQVYLHPNDKAQTEDSGNLVLSAGDGGGSTYVSPHWGTVSSFRPLSANAQDRRGGGGQQQEDDRRGVLAGDSQLSDERGRMHSAAPSSSTHADLMSSSIQTLNLLQGRGREEERSRRTTTNAGDIGGGGRLHSPSSVRYISPSSSPNKQTSSSSSSSSSNPWQVSSFPRLFPRSVTTETPSSSSSSSMAMPSSLPNSLTAPSSSAVQDRQSIQSFSSSGQHAAYDHLPTKQGHTSISHNVPLQSSSRHHSPPLSSSVYQRSSVKTPRSPSHPSSSESSCLPPSYSLETFPPPQAGFSPGLTTSVPSHNHPAAHLLSFSSNRLLSSSSTSPSSHTHRNPSPMNVSQEHHVSASHPEVLSSSSSSSSIPINSSSFPNPSRRQQQGPSLPPSPLLSPPSSSRGVFVPSSSSGVAAGRRDKETDVLVLSPRLSDSKSSASSAAITSLVVDEKRRSEFTEIAPNQWKWQLRLGPKGWRAFSRQMSLTSHFAVTSDQVARLLLQGKFPPRMNSLKEEANSSMTTSPDVSLMKSPSRRRHGETEAETDQVHRRDGKGGREEKEGEVVERREREIRGDDGRERRGRSREGELSRYDGETTGGREQSRKDDRGEQGEKGGGRKREEDRLGESGLKGGASIQDEEHHPNDDEDDELDRMIEEISSSSSSEEEEEEEEEQQHTSSPHSSPLSHRRLREGDLSPRDSPEKYLDALLESSSSDEEEEHLDSAASKDKQDDESPMENEEKRREDQREEKDKIKSSSLQDGDGNASENLSSTVDLPAAPSSTRDSDKHIECTADTSLDSIEVSTRRLEDTSNLPYVHVTMAPQLGRPAEPPLRDVHARTPITLGALHKTRSRPSVQLRLDRDLKRSKSAPVICDSQPISSVDDDRRYLPTSSSLSSSPSSSSSSPIKKHEGEKILLPGAHSTVDLSHASPSPSFYESSNNERRILSSSSSPLRTRPLSTSQLLNSPTTHSLQRHFFINEISSPLTSSLSPSQRNTTDSHSLMQRTREEDVPITQQESSSSASSSHGVGNRKESKGQEEDGSLLFSSTSKQKRGGEESLSSSYERTILHASASSSSVLRSRRSLVPHGNANKVSGMGLRGEKEEENLGPFHRLPLLVAGVGDRRSSEDDPRPRGEEKEEKEERGEEGRRIEEEEGDRHSDGHDEERKREKVLLSHSDHRQLTHDNNVEKYRWSRSRPMANSPTVASRHRSVSDSFLFSPSSVISSSSARQIVGELVAAATASRGWRRRELASHNKRLMSTFAGVISSASPRNHHSNVSGSSPFSSSFCPTCSPRRGHLRDARRDDKEEEDGPERVSQSLTASPSSFSFSSADTRGRGTEGKMETAGRLDLEKANSRERRSEADSMLRKGGRQRREETKSSEKIHTTTISRQSLTSTSSIGEEEELVSKDREEARRKRRGKGRDERDLEGDERGRTDEDLSSVSPEPDSSTRGKDASRPSRRHTASEERRAEDHYQEDPPDGNEKRRDKRDSSISSRHSYSTFPSVPFREVHAEEDVRVMRGSRRPSHQDREEMRRRGEDRGRESRESSRRSSVDITKRKESQGGRERSSSRRSSFIDKQEGETVDETKRRKKASEENMRKKDENRTLREEGEEGNRDDESRFTYSQHSPEENQLHRLTSGVHTPHMTKQTVPQGLVSQDDAHVDSYLHVNNNEVFFSSPFSSSPSQRIEREEKSQERRHIVGEHEEVEILQQTTTSLEERVVGREDHGVRTLHPPADEVSTAEERGDRVDSQDPINDRRRLSSEKRPFPGREEEEEESEREESLDRWNGSNISDASSLDEYLTRKDSLLLSPPQKLPSSKKKDSHSFKRTHHLDGDLSSSKDGLSHHDNLRLKSSLTSILSIQREVESSSLQQIPLSSSPDKEGKEVAYQGEADDHDRLEKNREKKAKEMEKRTHENIEEETPSHTGAPDEEKNKISSSLDYARGMDGNQESGEKEKRSSVGDSSSSSSSLGDDKNKKNEDDNVTSRNDVLVADACNDFSYQDDQDFHDTGEFFDSSFGGVNEGDRKEDEEKDPQGGGGEEDEEIQKKNLREGDRSDGNEESKDREKRRTPEEDSEHRQDENTDKESHSDQMNETASSSSSHPLPSSFLPLPSTHPPISTTTPSSSPLSSSSLLLPLPSSFSSAPPALPPPACSTPTRPLSPHSSSSSSRMNVHQAHEETSVRSPYIVSSVQRGIQTSPPSSPDYSHASSALVSKSTKEERRKKNEMLPLLAHGKGSSASASSRRPTATVRLPVITLGSRLVEERLVTNQDEDEEEEDYRDKDRSSRHRQGSSSSSSSFIGDREEGEEAHVDGFPLERIHEEAEEDEENPSKEELQQQPNRRYPRRKRLPPLKSWLGECPKYGYSPVDGTWGLVGVQRCVNQNALRTVACDVTVDGVLSLFIAGKKQQKKRQQLLRNGKLLELAVDERDKLKQHYLNLQSPRKALSHVNSSSRRRSERNKEEDDADKYEREEEEEQEEGGGRKRRSGGKKKNEELSSSSSRGKKLLALRDQDGGEEEEPKADTEGRRARSSSHKRSHESSGSGSRRREKGKRGEEAKGRKEKEREKKRRRGEKKGEEEGEDKDHADDDKRNNSKKQKVREGEVKPREEEEEMKKEMKKSRSRRIVTEDSEKETSDKEDQESSNEKKRGQESLHDSPLFHAEEEDDSRRSSHDARLPSALSEGVEGSVEESKEKKKGEEEGLGDERREEEQEREEEGVRQKSLKEQDLTSITYEDEKDGTKRIFRYKAITLPQEWFWMYANSQGTLQTALVSRCEGSHSVLLRIAYGEKKPLVDSGPYVHYGVVTSGKSLVVKKIRKKDEKGEEEEEEGCLDEGGMFFIPHHTKWSLTNQDDQDKKAVEVYLTFWSI
ncbi:hypothetical protein CSUI_002388 [Cystoisospora suis]|uniref:Uncharacterized protein n=1 Tax=Cystoisospora suis TaxID=483139 RepID=A0A2C6L9P6_9APIC|nr:hypothetical protein CSUI_002388 [Cystoisospora suis]